MPSLIDLASYKIISEKQLTDNYNRLVDAVNSNFDFTLAQVSNPIPAATTGQVNEVLTIKAGFVLGYSSLTDLISVSDVFSSFLNTSAQTLRLNNNLTLSLLSVGGASNQFTIAATLPGGMSVDGVVFRQLSSVGDMQEIHTVTQFTVAAKTASLNVATGYFQINALKVGTYALPTTTPTNNQILQANNSGNLEFKDPFIPVILSGDELILSNEKLPIRFGHSATIYPNLNIKLGVGETGIGFTEYWADNSARAYVYISGSEALQIVKPTNVSGNPVAPYVQLTSGLALAPASSIDPLSNPIGGLWYDSGTEGLILTTASGRKYISSQALTTSVNTEEIKDFVLQPASTFTVDAGSTVKPGLNIGNSAGLASNSSGLKVVVNGSAAVQISSVGLESAVAGSTATARLILNDTVGINNPTKPTYSFSGVEGLGIFRADTDAIGMAVKGQTVIEISEAKLNVKGNKVSNVAAPTEPQDAANKEYVDDRIPIGFTPGALPIVSSGTTSKYVQSDAKYLNGVLEIGSSAAPASFKMNSSSGGAAIIKAPATINNIIFELPSNNLNNGILQNVGGQSRWVSIDSITGNTLKADGSVNLSKGLNLTADSTPTSPAIGRGNTGVYAATEFASKIGFSAQGQRLLEVNASTRALVGASDIFNAPLIRLDNTITNYSSVGNSGQPTYAFAGESQTGLGQTQVQSVSLLVNGTAKISANANGISAHNNRVQAVSNPVQATDAATKGYVDTLVKARKELSFLVQTMPAGWTAGAALILSIYDKALIFNSAISSLSFESATDNKLVVVPSNFSVNPDCQVYVNNLRLVKMAKTSGVREVSYGTAESIVLNYNLAVGMVVTIHLPG